MNDSIYSVKDTVYYILKPISEDNNMSISLADRLTVIGLGLTIISLIVALWQFRKQMIYSREAAIESQKENWYLNIIVMPQLPEINKFYNSFIEEINNSRIELDSENETLSKKDWTLKLAQKKNNTKAIINETLDHLVCLVRSYNTSLASKVSDEVMKLEDISTYILDDYDTIDKNIIRKMILENKQNLLNILNSGLTINKVQTI